MNEDLIKKIQQWNLIGKTFIKAKQKIEQYLISKKNANAVDIRLSKCGINFEFPECNPQTIEVNYDYIEIDKCTFYIGCYFCKYDYSTGKEIADYLKIEE